MSIVQSDEIGAGRTGSVEYTNQQIIIRSTRMFRVLVDDQTHDDQYIILNGQTASPDPIPSVLATHPSNDELRAKNISANQEDGEGKGANAWLVTCQYDNQTSDADATDAETPPLDRRTKFHLEFAGFTRILERDIEGNPIVNTVGDIFDPPLEEEDERPVLVAVKNYDATNLSALMGLLADYRGSVNSDTWLGRPSGSWRLARTQMSPEQVEDDVRYHSVSYYFELKDEYEFSDPSTVEGTPEPWDRLVLNMGFRAYQAADTSGSRYNVVYTSTPIKLKQDGRAFTEDDDPNFYYRTFKTKKRRPFSALGLV